MGCDMWEIWSYLPPKAQFISTHWGLNGLNPRSPHRLPELPGTAVGELGPQATDVDAA